MNYWADAVQITGGLDRLHTRRRSPKLTAVILILIAARTPGRAVLPWAVSQRTSSVRRLPRYKCLGGAIVASRLRPLSDAHMRRPTAKGAQGRNGSGRRGLALVRRVAKAAELVQLVEIAEGDANVAALVRPLWRIVTLAPSARASLS